MEEKEKPEEIISEQTPITDSEEKNVAEENGTASLNGNGVTHPEEKPVRKKSAKKKVTEEATEEISSDEKPAKKKSSKKKTEEPAAETTVEDVPQAANEVVKADESVVSEVPVEEVPVTIESPVAETETVSTEPTEEKPADDPLKEKDNSAFLNEKIDKLIALKDEHNFPDFWFYAKEINTLIFSLRGLPKDERFKFKDRIGELCTETKKIQDEIKTRIARTSKIKLEKIEEMLREAVGEGTSQEEMEKYFQKIEEVSKFLREGEVTNTAGETSAEMSREDRETAKELIKKAKDKIFDHKREQREANFKVVTKKLTHLTTEVLEKNPRKVFDAVKKLREEMKGMTFDRGQMKEIDSVIQMLWKKAGERSDTHREYDTKKRITGMETMLSRKEQFIQTLEREIKDLNAKWSKVQNDFFKNRVNEWMIEKKEKVDSTKKEIESIREKIKFLREQLERQ